MSHLMEKPLKISKQLRLKAQEFLSSRNQTDKLMDIIQHFESGADLSSSLLALDLIFTSLLKDKSMFIEVVPLKPVVRTTENQYKELLKHAYEGCYTKILDCLENDNQKIKIQGLSTAMNILAYEGKFPLEIKGSLDSYVPLSKLRAIIMKLVSNKQDNSLLIIKFTEYLIYNDILFFTWKILPSITAKSNPNELYIMNFLILLEKLQLTQQDEPQFLCGNGNFFDFDENLTKRCLNKVWHCVMLWEHTPQTHKQLLIVLLERVLANLDKPLLMVDFLMDSLDAGGSVSLLALQGIFTMIQEHNLTYPNIFAKLYSMFEPEIFHTKYKARLFYLSDLFLSSTHLPENLVAAFVKRLARLALIAPSEDVIIICMFIGNLILRHSGLKCLLHHPTGGQISYDPYIMEERDPVKSNAINSSLWEIQTLQQHVLPSVASAAKFINNPLPNVEWDLSSVLSDNGNDIFDKELKKYTKLFLVAFDKPVGGLLSKGEKLGSYWNLF